MRTVLLISYLEYKTSIWVRSKINFLVSPQEPLLAIVKRRKLAWFGHAARHNSLPKTILQRTLEGGRRRGRQRKCWMDNAKEWTLLPMPELPTMAPCRKDWKRISAESSVMFLARRPSRSRGWTGQNWTSWSSAKKPAALIFAFPIIQLHFSVFSMNKFKYLMDSGPGSYLWSDELSFTPIWPLLLTGH